jgi:hypothetical protein
MVDAGRAEINSLGCGEGAKFDITNFGVRNENAKVWHLKLRMDKHTLIKTRHTSSIPSEDFPRKSLLKSCVCGSGTANYTHHSL